MASGESRQIWDGRVCLSSDESPYRWTASLTDAESDILNGLDNLKITRIEVHGYRHVRHRFFPSAETFDYGSVRYYALVMTADENWWDFSFERADRDSFELTIVHRPAYHGHGDDSSQWRGWLVKTDESNSNVNQLFKWLDQKSRIDHKFEVSENFAREIFNKVARIKTWDRLQGIVRSPWKQKGGSEWLGAIRYINLFGKEDYDDDRIGELRNEVDPGRSYMIKRVKVYKIPLSEKYWTNLALFHSYVVFQTLDAGGETLWWSFEKNTQCIILQRGLTEDSVRDLLRREKRCLSWFYWRPQLVGEGDCSDFSLADLIDFVHDNDELNITYHGTTENCQCFAQVVFNRLTNKALYYGLLPAAASIFNRWLTGNADPRPRNE